MGSSTHSNRLSQLQREILLAFFGHTQDFFLTGGAALAGYYLGHRSTDDLDLFTTPEKNVRAGIDALHAASAAFGADVRVVRETPDFKRFAVTRGPETTLVDLVVDRAPQIAEKATVGNVRIDTLREIAANKVCALLDRLEPRDLVDLRLLIAGGIELDAAIADARLKHAGVDPATIAWVLSQSPIPETAALPSGVARADVEAFRTALIAELTRSALPKE